MNDLMYASERLREDAGNEVGQGRLKALAAKVAAVAGRIRVLGMTRAAADLDAVAGDLVALADGLESNGPAAYRPLPRS